MPGLLWYSSKTIMKPSYFSDFYVVGFPVLL